MQKRALLLRALKYTVLTFATLHLITSYSLMLFRNINEGNLFTIIALDRVWPSLSASLEMFLVSQLIWVIVLGVYFVVLYRKERSKKTNKSS